MKIRTVRFSDIPHWLSLSREYDKYVLEIVASLTEWYGGGGVSMAFSDYMETKISKAEAFMAVNEQNDCCGIIAISKANNRVTFFGVSHHCDFLETGKVLLESALSMLDTNRDISVNVIKSGAEQILKEHDLFMEYGFVDTADDMENGVPVIRMERRFVALLGEDSQ